MVNRRIKYRHIQCFVAIVRSGSLKAAADRLSLGQPALSKTLKELEHHLESTLLTRDRGGIRLTPEGRVFLGHAERSLAALERGLDGIAELRTGGTAQLRVGSLPSVAARLMPRAVTEFRQIAPKARLTVIDGPHRYVVDRLRSGAIDLVVGRLGAPDTMQGLSFLQLYTERLVCVCRPGHPLAAVPGPMDLSRLRDWPVITPPEDAAIRGLVDTLMIAQGTDPLPDAIASVSGAFGRNFVRTSDALWLISEGVVAPDLAEGRLVALPLDMSLTAGPVGLMTRPDVTPSAEMTLFPEALTRAVAFLGLADAA